MSLIGWLNAVNEARFYKKRCEELEAKLFAEIDSNRLREDQLISAFIELTGSDIRKSRREPLIKEAPEGEEASQQREVSTSLRP